MQSINLLKQILKENEYCKKLIKKLFDKSFVMYVEDEKSFKSSNSCWICYRLIMREIGKFNVKTSVILNGLGKYMAFTIHENLVFIESIQFMNFSLDALVKNLSGNDVKNLLQKFSGEFLKLVKQKVLHPYG